MVDSNVPPPRPAAPDKISIPQRETVTTAAEPPYSDSASASSPTPEAPSSQQRPKPGDHDARSPPESSAAYQLSPSITDRVFPIRSVVSVQATPGSARADRSDYFANAASHRRQSYASTSESSIAQSYNSRQDHVDGQRGDVPSQTYQNAAMTSSTKRVNAPRLPPQVFSEIMSKGGPESDAGDRPSSSIGAASIRSGIASIDEGGGIMTARFKHVVTDGGHAIITGRDGETLQRCEDEPIHIPGAVQSFGLLIALREEEEGKLVVRVVSENSRKMIGYTPKQLFELESFTDILSEEQADNLLDHIDFIRDDQADVETNGPEVFTISIKCHGKPRTTKLWCAIHFNQRNENMIICEFELEEDHENPLVPLGDMTPEPPEDTLNSNPTQEEYEESTKNFSKPLRVLRSARKRKGEAAAMEVFNIMSQVQEQLASAPNLEIFLKVSCGVVKELTGFHRVMIYQFDQAWNGRVVTELVDPRATKDLYKGLNFPASDIPKQARDMYKYNKVRLLYDRDQETARLVCRTMADLEEPLDLTYAYLRAMSPIHIKYLANMAVRSSMSISINAFNELWGLIACHTYGPKGMRVSFPIRKMCRLVGDHASRNIERLSYASRLQARKLINTASTKANPSGYIIASSEDLLKLFDADFGLLAIRDETKILGNIDESQEALAMLEYLRVRQITSVFSSQDLATDFPDLRYEPGFKVIAGLLIVPLSVGGNDFIVFFRRGQLREVKWAGNPYEKVIKEGTEGYLEPRKSFKMWSERVMGKCREWKEEEIETAAVLCLVYGKFIEVWRQKEAALQSSQLTRLLLANSAHEVRTPLNAIINYLEIALESSIDEETRENLSKSHSASKSLIYVINDLLDLTKTEEGAELVKGEPFDFKTAITEATDPFHGDAKRKGISYEVIRGFGLPKRVIGDQRRIRQAISNVTANAIQNTSEGGVKVEIYVATREDDRCDVEVAVQDTGSGMDTKKLDALFRELEQVQTEGTAPLEDSLTNSTKALPASETTEKRTLGLGLAVVARTVRNMNGQLRLKSELGKGSRFVIQFPFYLPDGEPSNPVSDAGNTEGTITPQAERNLGEVMLIDRGSTMSDNPGNKSIHRKNSADSISSRKSLRSQLSNNSAQSNLSVKSDVDRLIEAIQEPQVYGDKRPMIGERSASTITANQPSKYASGDSTPVDPVRTRSRSLETANPNLSQVVPPHQRSIPVNNPGEQYLDNMSTPIRALKIPDEDLLTSSPTGKGIGSSPLVRESRPWPSSAPSESSKADNADKMQVLVAEDDPVNCRIIQKRLGKLGHVVTLTGNGEECATAYAERSGYYDVVLMDMQMPIVDGLSSTKLIRSHEKTHADHQLSSRASHNGRIPIIAVSASLEESKRQTYINAGFDGWILKPISFNRLSEIMNGIVDAKVREGALYQPGKWEKGGWFGKAQPESAYKADTKPSGEGTKQGEKEMGVAAPKIAAEEQKGGNTIDDEQERLRKAQEADAIEPPAHTEDAPPAEAGRSAKQEAG